MNGFAASLDSRSPCLRDIHRLINECHVVLQTDPSSLHARAVRGHACMKVKLWDQAVQDFSEILRQRPDDVHGRFSRGMALFKSGRVDDAHNDFSRVLEQNPNHVMARYARAGCYNSEGEFNQAIQEYMLALQHDEKENAEGFRAERRLDLHESAEKLIRKTMGASGTARLRVNSPLPSEVKTSFCLQESPVARPLTGQKPLTVQKQRIPSGSTTAKMPRKVVQVRVSLDDLATAVPPKSSEPNIPPMQEPSVLIPVVSHAEVPISNQNPKIANQQQQQQQQCCGPQVAAVRAVSKTVRRVTVAL